MGDAGEPSTGALAVYTVCAAAAVLLLDLVHGPGRGPDARDAWMLAVYGVLPLAAAVGWDLGWRPFPRVLWAAGVAAVGAPIALWAAPAPLLAGAAMAALFLVAAAREAGVDLARWGLSVGDWRWWAPRSAAILGALWLGVALAACLSPALREAYPSARSARWDLSTLARLQVWLILYMVGWEGFFRGFLLFGLARRDAVLAVLLQALPFFLLHARKPELEMAASFVGALLAGWFCLRARSFLPLVALHWGMNTAMQLVGWVYRHP